MVLVQNKLNRGLVYLQCEHTLWIIRTFRPMKGSWESHRHQRSWRERKKCTSSTLRGEEMGFLIKIWSEEVIKTQLKKMHWNTEMYSTLYFLKGCSGGVSTGEKATWKWRNFRSTKPYCQHIHFRWMPVNKPIKVNYRETLHIVDNNALA